MGLTFPLQMPGVPGARTAKIGGSTLVGVNRSPFTASSQVQLWAGTFLDLDIQLPPMVTRAKAEPWLAFMLGLQGQYGTFLAGDPNGSTPQGSASALVNMLRYGHDLTNVNWTLGSTGGIGNPVVTANATADPNGNANAACSIVFPATGGAQTSFIGQYAPGNPLNASKTLVFSIWLKASVATTIEIGIKDNPVSGGSQVVTLSLTASWQQFYIPVTFGAVASPQTFAYIQQDVSQASKTIYAWGGVLQYGTAPTLGSSALASSGNLMEPGPNVNGANQTGSTLVTAGWPLGSAIFQVGDYIQLGGSSGGNASQRIYKLLQSASSDLSGNATLQIFPNLRESPANGDFVHVQSPRGLFRMAQNRNEFTLDYMLAYSVGFKAIEAI